MREVRVVSLIIAASVLLLLFSVDTLSISYYEADIFYNKNSTAHYLVRFFCTVFGQNDYSLRMPFIILHTGSSFLIYLIGRLTLKREMDRVIAVLIYVMLPGTISVALLVNGVGVVIFCTLLAIFLYQTGQRVLFCLVLFSTIFLDMGFVILYFLLFFYAIFKKDTLLMTVSLAFFTISAYMYGDQLTNISGGKPRGHFLDTIGIYAAIFSPLLFLYFIYVEYRILIKGGRTILWWLSFGAFIVSLLLSFRQRIPVEMLALYLTISTPIIVGTFFSSYRVRLPKHRKVHNFFAGLVVLSLIFNSVLVFANQMLYPFFQKPSNHFAYKYHVAKELASILKDMGIEKIQIDDKKLALRLKFYGIEEGGDSILIQSPNGDIVIEYTGTKIATFEILKADYQSI